MVTRQSPGPPAGHDVVVMAVGGLDPGCGAGLVRDVLSAAALGARARVVVTAWTDQSPAGVRGVEPRAPGAVRDNLRAALAAERAAGGAALAVKIGMVATAEIATALVDALEGFAGAVVLDPVLAASSGGRLFDGDPRALLPLARRATLTTPNLPEAAALAALRVTSLDEAAAAAGRLRAEGVPAVLIKGGHLGEDEDASDLLSAGVTVRTFRSARVRGKSPRGTGCALATSIAVELARGSDLELAVDRSRAWLVERIAQARDVGNERHLPT